MGVSRRIRCSGQKKKAEWETAELKRCRVVKLSSLCPRQVVVNRKWKVGSAEELMLSNCGAGEDS